MNKQKKTNNKTLLKWVHQNRIKVGILLFVVTLPIALIFTAYVGSYISNKSLYFEDEITAESVKIKKFVAPNKLKTIDINIEWDTLKRPIEDEDGELQNGYYRFNLSYTPKNNYNVTSVKVAPVLKTDWKDMESVGTEKPLSRSDSSFLIFFNYKLPKSPLLFVTIEDPNLFLKVEYTYKLAGQEVTEIEYVKFSLKGLNPKIVVPNL